MSHPLTDTDMLELQRWNTPTIYNGWEQITKQHAAHDGFNLEETRDFMPEALPERAELSQPRKKPLSRCDTLSTKPPSQISPTNHLPKTP
jgi:hypothetical protein